LKKKQKEHSKIKKTRVREQKEDLFFIEVKDHFHVKRNLLESLKSILELLRKFETLKQIRQEKLEKIQKLGALVRDANKLLGTLRSKLPQTGLKPSIHHLTIRQPQKEHPKKKEKPVKIVEQPKRELTEMEKLEAELNAIENKLRSLT
jgi:hypothetical protein